MPTPPVWFEVFGAGAGRAGERLLEELAQRGIACAPLERSQPLRSGPGLALFAPGSSGLTKRLRELSRGGEVRVLAVASERRALGRDETWDLLAAGAADLVCCRGHADPAAAVAARLERWREVDGLIDSPVVRSNLVGDSSAWCAVLRQVVEAARFGDSAVLIGGETGTGKELVARLIHTLDGRPDKRELVVLDCTTIVPELSGSEFFGHERGAYTGAVAARDGAFALADGGTLFLDEVGELPRRLQAELLRVVQEGSYKRVGSSAWRETDFRLVCATHRDLAGEVGDGRFRRDFFHRIADGVVRLPTLAERRRDIPLLVAHFAAELTGGEAPEIDPAVLDLLMERDYPGNVRDLRQLVRRILRHHVGDGPVTAGMVPAEERPPSGKVAAGGRQDGFEEAARLALGRGMGLKEISNAAADAAVEVALAEEPDQQRAADRLGVSRRAVQMRLANLRRRSS